MDSENFKRDVDKMVRSIATAISYEYGLLLFSEFQNQLVRNYAKNDEDKWNIRKYFSKKVCSSYLNDKGNIAVGNVMMA